MHDNVSKLAVHIDKYTHAKAPDYPERLLAEAIPNAEKAKGRLLYYFPLDEEDVKDGKPDSWTGWHNDTGFLTALAGDCYFNHDTGEVIECPDPEAGLYAVARDGSEIKIDIPKYEIIIKISSKFSLTFSSMKTKSNQIKIKPQTICLSNQNLDFVLGIAWRCS